MNILIIEDEAPIARRIERFIREILLDRDVTIVSINSLDTGKAYLKKNSIDLLFLDLNLNGEDGFETLKEAVSNSFHTIVVSAFSNRAVTAFEYGVLDFVSKPFDKKRIAKAINRVESNLTKEGVGIKYLAIRKNKSIILLDIKEILFIQGAGIYTEVNLKNGTKEIHDKSLDKLMQLLPNNFERIHKSYIVDMNEAKEYKTYPGSKYELILNSNHVLPIGRTRYKIFKAKWFN